MHRPVREANEPPLKLRGYFALGRTPGERNVARGWFVQRSTFLPHLGQKVLLARMTAPQAGQLKSLVFAST